MPGACVPVAFLAAAIVASALGCTAHREDDAERDPLHERVIRAYGGTRPLEGRLAGISGYAPCFLPSGAHARVLAPCAPPVNRPPDVGALSEAAQDVAIALSREPGRDALWAGALIDLASQGRRLESVDRAIGRLAAAWAIDSGNGLVVSDLAVAYVARATLVRGTASLYLALDAIERAAHRVPLSDEVRFNRALIFEKVGLTRQAETLWRLLESEAHDPAWRSEVHARRQQLGRLVSSALRGVQRTAAWQARYGALIVDGRRLEDLSLPAAAAALYREAYEVARFTGRTEDPPESLGRRAAALVQLGDSSGAAIALDSARLLYPMVTHAANRARLDAELALAEATLARGRDVARALDRFDLAERYFAKSHRDVSRITTLVDRARLLLSSADSAGAQSDLDLASGLVARPMTFAQPRDRVTLLGARRDIHHLAMSMALARGDSVRALEGAFRSRGESWRGETELRTFLSTLPPDEARVQYAVLADGIVAVVLTRGGFHVVRDNEPTSTLRRDVRRFVDAIRRDDPAVSSRDLGSVLYHRLVAPILADLGDARRLVIVPDGAVDSVPFAVLAPVEGRALVEDFTISYAASLRAAWRPVAAIEAWNPLFVGNPAVDDPRFHEISPLPIADAEVRDARAMYRHSDALLGADATKDALLRELTRHDLVHFAGRACAFAPESARFDLGHPPSAQEIDERVVHASDVARLHLQSVRLVILSACRRTELRANSGDITDDGELPDAFLRAGARGVISTLWEADDAGTATLMRELHRALSRGETPDEALRGAQLLMRRGGDGGTDRVWAAFRYQNR